MRVRPLWLLAAPLALAQHTPAERYVLFQKNLAMRGEAITRDQFQGIDSLEEWKRRR